MRLLLFSDLHENVNAAKRIVQQSRGVDVVIGAGDFGNLRRGLGNCISILTGIDCPVVLVPGNNESFEELQRACFGWGSAHVLHGETTVINGISFFGIGGAVPITPFGSWSYDFSEDEASDLLTACPPQCILVSHSPPYGAVDVSSRGDRLGSTSVRQSILKTQPLLVVCGHIHASAGQMATIGISPVINAGPRGIEWELVGV